VKSLVTGAAGFIGYHLAASLADRGDDVVVCDDLSRGSMDRELKELIARPNVEFIQKDLTNPILDGELGDAYDVVYHLAALNGTRHFYERPLDVLRINILSVMSVMDWAVAGGSRKVVWASSAETYAGNVELGTLMMPTLETIPLVVSDVFNARWSYAASKIAGELFCVNYARTYGLPTVVIRPHNVYGPRMGHDHVVPAFIGRALKKEDPFPIFGSDQTRTFCYVEDFADGLIRAGRTQLSECEVINLGGDCETVIAELAEVVCRIAGYRPEFADKPAPEGSVPRRCPDISVARERLGFAPRVSLDDGLALTFAWYKAEAERSGL
jgi:UDP-glucose 4-epimerase/UDP-glucuronate decarboxylase